MRCYGWWHGNTSAFWSHLKKNHDEEHAGKQPTIVGLMSSRTPYGPNHKKQKQFTVREGRFMDT